MEKNKEYKEGDILLKKFTVVSKLGQGSFGMIYKCFSMVLNKHFAVKIEKKGEYEILKHEAKILDKFRNWEGFPKLHFYEENEEENVMGMSILGPNLEKQFRNCGGVFSFQTVLYIAIQLVQRLEIIHDCGFIHRDLKPENCLTSWKDNKIYLIDFGLSKQIIDFNGKHIQMGSREGLIGTTRYMSVNAHKQFDQSRRDDLESLAYILLYFLHGSLPW